MTKIWYSNCLLYTVTSEFIRVTESLQTIFMFILELIEESKDNEELSEVEKKNHATTGEKLLSCSQTKQKDLMNRGAKKSFTCFQCGKSFTYKHHLELHTRVHTGEKPYTCDQCGKSFTQSSSLKIHMNIHTGEKPYNCSHCDKKFSRSGDLEKHKLVHTGEKPHTCDQCGRSFVQKQHFTAHVRVHTGEKPYKCLYCDKRFSQSGNLKTHKRIHTGEKPYHCTACGKCFNHSDSLHSHTKNYHSKQIIFISSKMAPQIAATVLCSSVSGLLLFVFCFSNTISFTRDELLNICRTHHKIFYRILIIRTFCWTL